MFFIAAIVQGSRAPMRSYVTRLWLPAGVMFDSFCHELLTRYSHPELALKLCRERTALRGLPSRFQNASQEETDFLLPDRPEVSDEDQLRALVEKHDAEGALVFDKGEWWKFFGPGRMERIRDLTLLSIRAA